MSGINIVVGPPAAGNGLWLIQVVRDILLDTQQTIVTNFAVKLPELNDRPMASGVFRLSVDHGLQNCFETAAGVGMAGMNADRGEKRKGLSLLWVLPAIAVMAFLLIKAPLWLAKGLSGATMGASKTAANAYKIGSANTTGVPETSGLFAGIPTPAEPAHTNAAFKIQSGNQIGPPPEEKPKEVFLTGISSFGGNVRVYLSNGEAYTSADKELQY